MHQNLFLLKQENIMRNMLFWRYLMALFAILIITAGIYWQGVAGGQFIFDDHANLSDLSILTADNTDSETNADNRWSKFILEGFSGPSGRPISLFSFALQASHWPDNPAAFKVVNIILHLLNGVLLFILLWQLMGFVHGTEKWRLNIALLTTAIWLLHPLHVSTVLYVVQRMTELSTLFTLLALIGYLIGRQLLLQQRIKAAFLWMSLSLTIGGIFAVLSKENGILLILYVLVLEFTLLSNFIRPRLWHIWASIFLYLPLAVLIAYFASRFPIYLEMYDARPFTLQERLLTQPRVLLDYVSKLLLLQPTQFGLFQDDFVLSKSIFNPIYTLSVIAVWLGLFLTALLTRKRWPIIAFAILWFLAGHVLESSFIPLLIYFEHRNYLPSIGILLGLVYLAVQLGIYLSQRPIAKIAYSLMLIWCLSLPLLSYQESRLWGMPLAQAKIWADTRPYSRLALLNAAAVFAADGNFKIMQYYHQQLARHFPNEVSPILTILATVCRHESIVKPDSSTLFPLLTHGQVDAQTPAAVDFFTKSALGGHCARLSYDEIEEIILHLLSNPNIEPYAVDLYAIYADFLGQTKRPLEAVNAADEVLKRFHSIPMQLNKVHWLLQAQKYQMAQDYLLEIRQQWNYWQSRTYQSEWQKLNDLITQIIETQFELHF
jgi:protein O-mannosyl-transferase